MQIIISVEIKFNEENNFTDTTEILNVFYHGSEEIFLLERLNPYCLRLQSEI